MPSANENVYVFAGSFPSRRAACKYVEPQWAPEPPASASDGVYEAWEDNNPSCVFYDELGTRLDEDLVETITGARRYSYLAKMLVKPGAIAEIEKRAPRAANTLVLVFGEALGGARARMRSTSKLTYCGRYRCDLDTALD